MKPKTAAIEEIREFRKSVYETFVSLQNSKETDIVKFWKLSFYKLMYDFWDNLDANYPELELKEALRKETKNLFERMENCNLYHEDPFERMKNRTEYSVCYHLLDNLTVVKSKFPDYAENY
jgi:hypothetical protein